MGKILFQWLCVAMLLLYIISCQTSPVKTFDEDVKIGMDKNQILHIMGTPNTSGRFHGKDRWIYVVYDNDVRYRKEVHFDDGHAVYVGNEYVPPAGKQASAVDHTQSAEEQVIQAEEKKQNQEVGNQLNKYEDDIHGKNNVIYLPQFQPIK